MQLDRVVYHGSVALLLALASAVAAHGDEHDSMEGMSMGDSLSAVAGSVVDAAAKTTVSLSYFRHPEYHGWLYAHIATMVLAWMIVLPVGKKMGNEEPRLLR